MYTNPTTTPSSSYQTNTSSPSNTSGTNSSSGALASATSGIANEQTFLQLFVSQLQNQDPLNPADGTQFVSQLAQFSELEQMININQNVGAIEQQVVPASTTTGTATGSSQSSGATTS